MWDARLEAIRDRKLNEMIIFAAMVRAEPSKRHEFVAIIEMLDKDLDLVEALAENGPIPKTEPIEFESYRSRLSKLELMDEYCLDSCRKGENDFGPIICKEHMTTSVAVKQKPEAPAVIPDYPKPVQVQEESEVEAPEKPSPIPIHAINQDMPEVIPPEKPASMTEVESNEEAAEAEPEPVREPAGSEEGIYDIILSIEDAVTLKRAREMKDSKVDLFIDREMNGHFDDDACEDVITFLKTDIRLIDLILSINVSSKEDIESKVKAIVDLVASADEPRHQNLYFNALNGEERKLEGEYNEALKRLEKVIAERYSHVLEEKESSLFFA